MSGKQFFIKKKVTSYGSKTALNTKWARQDAPLNNTPECGHLDTAWAGNVGLPFEWAHVRPKRAPRNLVHNGRAWTPKVWEPMVAQLLGVHIPPQNGSPTMGTRHGRTWAPIIGQPGMPNLVAHFCPIWTATSALLGLPCPSNLEAHIYPRWASNFVHVGSPLLSILGTQSYPRWTANSVHNGSPCLPTLDVHTPPRWESMLVHTGRPNPPRLEAQLCPRRESMLVHVGLPPPSTADAQSPPKLEAHLHPRRVSTSAQVESPILVRGHPKAAEDWKPIRGAWMPGSCRSWAANPCTRAPMRKGWMPKKDTATHPELWKPTCSGGHATCNVWMRVDAQCRRWATTPSCGRPWLCVATRNVRMWAHV